MLKRRLLILPLLFFVSVCYAADKTLMNLVEDTTPLSTDIFYVVHDPGGSPADKKVTLGNIGKAIGDIGGVTPGAGTFTTLTTTGNEMIGSNAAGANLTINATLNSELAPALTAGNWTVGSGWESPIVGPGLIKNADGTGTQTPSAATTIVAGTTYKVVITLSAISVGIASYTVGGVTGPSSLAAATTYTDYLTAATTGKLIITPTSTSRFTISVISIKALIDATGDLTVDGNLTVRSGINSGYVPYSSYGTLLGSQIYTDGTNIGINTTTPRHLLQLGSSLPFGVGSGTAFNGGVGFSFNAYWSTNNWVRIVGYPASIVSMNDGGNAGDISIYQTGTDAAGSTITWTAPTLYLKNTGTGSTSGGSVGVGTTIPQNPLDVITRASVSTLLTNASNYERLLITGVVGTSLNLTAQSAGTGSANLDLILTPKGTGAVGIEGLQTAGALTGTLLTSVATGNPTVWFRIKNGSSYYAVPGWLIP